MVTVGLFLSHMTVVSLPVCVLYSSTSKNDEIPVGTREFSG